MPRLFSDRGRIAGDRAMKTAGGILGILGGLFGGCVALFFFLAGASSLASDSSEVEPVLGVGLSAMGLIGGICSIACIVLGIVVLATRGRFAGAIMLLPAIIGIYLTYGGTSFAVIGGFLAA